jgi:tRNA U38,U39,U40 pseudouridine synthase TruA
MPESTLSRSKKKYAGPLTRREYLYRIDSNLRGFMNYIQQENKLCWSIREKLDWLRIEQMAQSFVGEHDFYNFMSKSERDVTYPELR